MVFNRITDNDLKEITTYLREQPYKTCDYTILGIYMWIDYFHYEFSISDDILYMREKVEKDGHEIYQYLLPLSKKYNLETCINKLKKYVNEGTNQILLLDLVPEEFLTCFRYENKECVDDWSDYIYNSNDLASLKGKKFNKKRNLIHQFLNLYDEYEFKSIDDDVIADLVSFSRKDVFNDSDLAIYENNKTIDILYNFKLYKCDGYYLSHKSQIIGFVIGEVVQDVLYIHIEKADVSYKGVYQMLNWLFVNTELKKNDFKFVNLEEDVGDEGLRKAKLSYNPIIINKKFKVEIKL